MPKPGAVTKTVAKTPGITEWTLSNGVRVVLAPTTFKQDEILFRAFSPGGTSLAADRDFVAAETADRVVAQGGLGALTAIDLSKKLAGKTAFVRPDIDEMYEGLSGRALRRDVETMFQLIYLTFTAAARRSGSVPRDDRPGDCGVGQPRSASGCGVRGCAQRGGEPEPPAGAAPESGARRADEPGQVAGVLQGPLRRCERLHVRSRRQLRSADDQAARRAVSGQPAGAPSEGSRAGRRHPASGRRGGKGSHQREHAQEPGRRRLQRPVPEQSAGIA